MNAANQELEEREQQGDDAQTSHYVCEYCKRLMRTGDGPVCHFHDVEGNKRTYCYSCYQAHMRGDL